MVEDVMVLISRIFVTRIDKKSRLPYLRSSILPASSVMQDRLSWFHLDAATGTHKFHG